MRQPLILVLIVVLPAATALQTRAGIVERAGVQLVSGALAQFGSGRRPQDAQRNRSPNGQTLAYPDGTTEATEVQSFWKLMERVRPRLQQRGAAPPARNVGDGELAWIIDSATVGFTYPSDGPTRFLAVRLAVGNRTDEPMTIPGASLSAVIDGEARPLKPLDRQLANSGFSLGDVYHPLQACQPPEQMQVPPGGIASAWLVFPDLPANTSVPPAQLKFTLMETEVAVDIHEHQRAILDLEVERLGPQQCLALVTIGGPMNSLNVQSIVEDLDALVTQQVVRAVLRWKPNAPKIDGQIANWLQNTVSNAGTNRFTSQQLPTFPAQLRELHLVQPPQGGLADPNANVRPGAIPRFHATDADAVATALRTTYFSLTPEDVRKQISSGHLLARAAALSYGSNRLQPADLDLVLSLTRNDDLGLRLAAFRGLREFGEPAATDTLEHAVRQGPDDEARAAVDALADSRYASSRERLASLIDGADPSLTDRIVSILAAQPRPAWSDVLRAHATTSQGKLRVDVLRALVQLDHPEIVDLLAQGLKGSDPSVRDFVFPILARRSDERSHRLAADHVLASLASETPDSTMIEFLSRSRDRRALPSLLSKLDQKGDKAAIISLLGQLGDRATGDKLASEFDKFQVLEQSATIHALRVLRHPGFLDVADKALSGSQSPVVLNAIQALAQEGSRQAEQRLCEALLTDKRPEILQPLAMQLMSLGTPRARETLKQALQSKDQARRNAAQTGLSNLRSNSPANSYIVQAANFAQAKQWTEATELFRVATELDPYLPEGFSGLGDVCLKQEKWSDAVPPFEKALELNPEDGNSISGIAIAKVMLDQLDEGLKLVTDAKPKFEKDPVFLYNRACVLGRGIEQLEKQPASKERDERIASFRQQALAELQQSLKFGFDQIDWMQKDPDLNRLQGLDEFKEMVRTATATPKAE